jgi:hypothetical protein
MKKVVIAPEASKAELRVSEVKDNQVQSGDEMTPAHRTALRKAEMRQQFNTLADQIAEHCLYFRNWKFHGADQVFPKDPEARFVTKMYPYAKGGMLLVDEPRTEKQMLQAYERHKFFNKKKIRHIVIEADSSLYDLLEQLGEM